MADYRNKKKTRKNAKRHRKLNKKIEDEEDI